MAIPFIPGSWIGLTALAKVAAGKGWEAQRSSGRRDCQTSLRTDGCV